MLHNYPFTILLIRRMRGEDQRRTAAGDDRIPFAERTHGGRNGRRCDCMRGGVVVVVVVIVADSGGG